MEEKDRTLDAICRKNTSWERKNKKRARSAKTTADRPLWSALASLMSLQYITHTQSHIPTHRYIWEEELMCSDEYQKLTEERLAKDPEAPAKADDSADESLEIG